MANSKIPKKSLFIFNCSLCDYTTSNKKDYNKHISTQKHLRLNATKKKSPNDISSNFICINCGNQYKHQSSLCKHRKICPTIILDNNLDYWECSSIPNGETNSFIKSNKETKITREERNSINTEKIDNNILTQLIQQNLSLITQNSEFKELILEQNKHIIELSKEKTMNNCNNITNNNNNHFNLNLFLNETCKNAMNINDFVEQIPIHLSDLEDTARLGYAEGISRIFIRGLKDLEVNQRPIHCSDAKRETLYIKDGDKWEKDDTNKTKLETAIRKVGSKNIRLIPEWRKEHPYCENYDSKKNDLYLKIVGNSMCGGSIEETEHNYNKIKKNIIKQVVIEK
jgi:hypothetical protein